MVTYSEGRPWSVLALDIRGEHIAAIYIVADQNKLTHFPALHDRA